MNTENATGAPTSNILTDDGLALITNVVESAGGPVSVEIDDLRALIAAARERAALAATQCAKPIAAPGGGMLCGEVEALRTRLAEYTEGRCAVTDPPEPGARRWLCYSHRRDELMLQCVAEYTGLWRPLDTGSPIPSTSLSPGSRYYPLPGERDHG